MKTIRNLYLILTTITIYTIGLLTFCHFININDINIVLLIFLASMWYIISLLISYKTSKYWNRLIIKSIRKYHLIFNKSKCMKIQFENKNQIKFNDVLEIETGLEGGSNIYRYLGNNIILKIK